MDRSITPAFPNPAIQKADGDPCQQRRRLENPLRFQRSEMRQSTRSPRRFLAGRNEIEIKTRRFVPRQSRAQPSKARLIARARAGQLANLCKRLTRARRFRVGGRSSIETSIIETSRFRSGLTVAGISGASPSALLNVLGRQDYKPASPPPSAVIIIISRSLACTLLLPSLSFLIHSRCILRRRE